MSDDLLANLKKKNKLTSSLQQELNTQQVTTSIESDESEPEPIKFLPSNKELAEEIRFHLENIQNLYADSKPVFTDKGFTQEAKEVLSKENLAKIRTLLSNFGILLNQNNKLALEIKNKNTELRAKDKAIHTLTMQLVEAENKLVENQDGNLSIENTKEIAILKHQMKSMTQLIQQFGNILPNPINQTMKSFSLTHSSPEKAQLLLSEVNLDYNSLYVKYHNKYQKLLTYSKAWYLSEVLLDIADVYLEEKYRLKKKEIPDQDEPQIILAGFFSKYTNKSSALSLFKPNSEGILHPMVDEWISVKKEKAGRKEVYKVLAKSALIELLAFSQMYLEIERRLERTQKFIKANQDSTGFRYFMAGLSQRDFFPSNIDQLKLVLVNNREAKLSQNELLELRNQMIAGAIVDKIRITPRTCELRWFNYDIIQGLFLPLLPYQAQETGIPTTNE